MQNNLPDLGFSKSHDNVNTCNMQVIHVGPPDPSSSLSILENLQDGVNKHTQLDCMSLDHPILIQSDQDALKEADHENDNLSTDGHDDSSFEEEEYCDPYLKD